MKNNSKKEIILYIIFGIITTIINIGLFYILNKIGLKYIIANLIALISAKFAAYLCNKFFVFKKKCKNKKELTKEILLFIFWRGISMIIDFIGLIILIEVFSFDKMIGKTLITIVVIIINYFACKNRIFKIE